MKDVRSGRYALPTTMSSLEEMVESFLAKINSKESMEQECTYLISSGSKEIKILLIHGLLKIQLLMRDQACLALNASSTLVRIPAEFIISTKIEMSPLECKDIRKKDQKHKK
jgi:hypothetical protein